MTIVAMIMLRRHLGLTALYNLVNDSGGPRAMPDVGADA